MKFSSLALLFAVVSVVPAMGRAQEAAFAVGRTYVVDKDFRLRTSDPMDSEGAVSYTYQAGRVVGQYTQAVRKVSKKFDAFAPSCSVSSTNRLGWVDVTIERGDRLQATAVDATQRQITFKIYDTSDQLMEMSVFVFCSLPEGKPLSPELLKSITGFALARDGR